MKCHGNSAIISVSFVGILAGLDLSSFHWDPRGPLVPEQVPFELHQLHEGTIACLRHLNFSCLVDLRASGLRLQTFGSIQDISSVFWVRSGSFAVCIGTIPQLFGGSCSFTARSWQGLAILGTIWELLGTPMKNPRWVFHLGPERHHVCLNKLSWSKLTTVGGC